MPSSPAPAPLASRALVAAAFALIALVAGAHFRWFLPRASTCGGCHLALSVFLLLEVLALYALAATSDPGYVAKDSTVKMATAAAAAAAEEEEGEDAESVMMAAMTLTQQCAKCAAEKPRRAHHCRTCGRCVREMDHHCVWLSNCVGAGNYRFFWTLLLYLWLSCAYVAAFALEPFRETLEARRRRAAGLEPTPELAVRLRNTLVIFSFLLTSALGVVLAGYWAWHAYLVSTHQTTIEFVANRRDAPERDAEAAAARSGRQRLDQLTRSLQRMLGRADRLWLLALVVPTMTSRGPKRADA